MESLTRISLLFETQNLNLSSNNELTADNAFRVDVLVSCQPDTRGEQILCLISR
jgi:hypothetical protein